MNSQLSLVKLERVFNIEPPSWNQGLADCLEDLIKDIN